MNALYVLAFLLASQGSINNPGDSAPVGEQPSNASAVVAQIDSLNMQMNNQAAECKATADALRMLRENEPQRPTRQDTITTAEYEKGMQDWHKRVAAQEARVAACSAKLDKLQAQIEKLSERIPSSDRKKVKKPN